MCNLKKGAIMHTQCIFYVEYVINCLTEGMLVVRRAQHENEATISHTYFLNSRLLGTESQK